MVIQADSGWYGCFFEDIFWYIRPDYAAVDIFDMLVIVGGIGNGVHNVDRVAACKKQPDGRKGADPEERDEVVHRFEAILMMLVLYFIFIE